MDQDLLKQIRGKSNTKDTKTNNPDAGNQKYNLLE